MVISIHALRGESDITPAGSIYDVKISIHALRGESDPVLANIGEQAILFQSTLSEGRATDRRFCRVRQGGISIHVLRGESDPV